MKTLRPLFFLLAVAATLPATAQYYYKDIVSTRESAALLKTYLAANVREVRLASYDGENVKSDDLLVQQSVTPAQRMLRTLTQVDGGRPSVLLTYLNADGLIEKTIDSSGRGSGVIRYAYTPAGLLQSVSSTVYDSAGAVLDTEVHLWEYNDGKPLRMLRIKGAADTALVQVKLDEEGRVIEETLVQKGRANKPIYMYYDKNKRLTDIVEGVVNEPVYYYYNGQGRLSDIVRYNNKARKLLPEMMFEYTPAGQVSQSITIPGNNSNYFIWRYQYDERGLKIKEAVYDKYKKLNGKIEYLYSFF
jgi:hypothetical protein